MAPGSTSRPTRRLSSSSRMSVTSGWRAADGRPSGFGFVVGVVLAVAVDLHHQPCVAAVTGATLSRPAAASAELDQAVIEPLRGRRAGVGERSAPHRRQGDVGETENGLTLSAAGTRTRPISARSTVMSVLTSDERLRQMKSSGNSSSGCCSPIPAAECREAGADVVSVVVDVAREPQ